jgi:hypothetical protein
LDGRCGLRQKIANRASRIDRRLAGKLTEYDILGQVKRGSVPTEVNSSERGDEKPISRRGDSIQE